MQNHRFWLQYKGPVDKNVKVAIQLRNTDLHVPPNGQEKRAFRWSIRRMGSGSHIVHDADRVATIFRPL